MILLMLGGCDGWYQLETNYLVGFIAKTMPHTYVTMRTNVSIEEEDNYGRLLLQYSDTHIKAYVICQNTNHTNTCYYYEDEHVIVADSFDDISEQDIIELKAKNDWGKMLNPSRMVKFVKKRNSSSESQDFSEIKESVCHFGNYEQENVVVHVADVFNDDSSKQLMVVKVYDEDGIYDGILLKSYFVLCTQFPKESLVIEEIQDYYHYQEQVIRMKRENKWARRTVKFTDLYLSE